MPRLVSFLFNNTTSGSDPHPTPRGLPTRPWTFQESITDLGLGAIQGVVVRDGKVYAYGDVFQAKPRVGVIRESNELLEPTGRIVWLSTWGGTIDRTPHRADLARGAGAHFWATPSRQPIRRGRVR